MKYSFHCRKCGQTVMSNSKEEVKGARALHKARRITLPNGTGYDIPKCRLVPVAADPDKFGRRNYPATIARPALAQLLNARRAANA